MRTHLHFLTTKPGEAAPRIEEAELTITVARVDGKPLDKLKVWYVMDLAVASLKEELDKEVKTILEADKAAGHE
jgi:hypothetical protein